MDTDERQILPAMRLLPYDRLVLVGGRDAFASAGFRRLAAIEPSAEKVPVDPMDFLACLDAILRAIRRAGREGSVRLSVGGGSKLLSSAAILAAFHEGIEAWYCDPEPIRLPVLQGLRIVEAFTPEEALLGRLVLRPTGFERLVRSAVRRGLSRHVASNGLRSLVRKGLLDVEVIDGTPTLRPTATLAVLRPHLRALAGKA
jgi:hypothetical protein